MAARPARVRPRHRRRHCHRPRLAPPTAAALPAAEPHTGLRAWRLRRGGGDGGGARAPCRCRRHCRLHHLLRTACAAASGLRQHPHHRCWLCRRRRTSPPCLVLSPVPSTCHRAGAPVPGVQWTPRRRHRWRKHRTRTSQVVPRRPLHLKSQVVRPLPQAHASARACTNDAEPASATAVTGMTLVHAWRSTERTQSCLRHSHCNRTGRCRRAAGSSSSSSAPDRQAPQRQQRDDELVDLLRRLQHVRQRGALPEGVRRHHVPDVRHLDRVPAGGRTRARTGEDTAKRRETEQLEWWCGGGTLRATPTSVRCSCCC